MVDILQPAVPGNLAIEAPQRAPEVVVETEATALGLVELLLKDTRRLDRLNCDPARQREMFPRFLLIALSINVIYGALLALLFNLVPAAAHPNTWVPLPSASWADGNAWSLPVAYAAGLVLAACVCLPAFYFYSLLAGVRMSSLQITALVGKGMVANAILLIGVAPLYVILALGALILHADAQMLEGILGIGLLLPFAAGLWGLYAIYQGLMCLADTLPTEWQCRRRCFLRRLVASWTLVYAAVVPVMVYRLWETCSGF